MDAQLVRLLSDADQELGRLDGVAAVLPNPDLFVAMYVRHEAVLSSQIEGTQSTLEDVLQFESDSKTIVPTRDLEEVVNYVRAMNHGLARLHEGFPLCLRLIREIHSELLRGVRGERQAPGEFRRTQNWLGPAGCGLADAEFVPPPPHEVLPALGNLEQFLHDRESLPTLVHCALAHAQFETIHPFLDGNGRVGRLLITLLLCQRGVLRRPLLYLSYFLKAHRAQYYDRLTAIREDGDWEGWVRFFLRGVHEVSRTASRTAQAILHLQQQHRDLVLRESRNSTNGLRLLDHLFEQPIQSVRAIEKHLGCSFMTAANVVQEFERLGILRETTGRHRDRRYAYDAYIALFQQQTIA